jgi:hypothetical protein
MGGMMAQGTHRIAATELLGCSLNVLNVPFSTINIVQTDFTEVTKIKYVKRYTDRFTGDPYSEPAEFSLTATDGSRRNLILWDACAYSSAENKIVTTDLQITNNTSSHNAGIIVNHRTVNPLTNPQIEYFHALLDRDANRLRLMRVVNGSAFEIAGVFLGDVVQYNHWYRMVVETFENPINPAETIIKTTVSGVTNVGWSTATLSVSTSNFTPDDGLFGLGTSRGYSRFSFFQIEERP